jgi:peptidoglycan/LPS O-acetylase OafA/YrhL
MNPNTKPFFGGLESLRGVAALIVVLHHTQYTVSSVLSPFFRNGYLMVDLFFVLSGFVIYHNYSQKIGSIRDILKFMFLRFGRLYPLHLFMLLVFLGVEIGEYIRESRFGISPHETPAFTLNNMPSLIANLLLAQSFFPSTNKTFNPPSWSIGTEFYTYLVFAFLALIFFRKSKFAFASFVVVSMAILLLSLWAGAGPSSDAGLSADAGLSFLRCILGFFVGTLAYQAYVNYHPHLARWSEAVVWGVAIFLFIFFILHSHSVSDFIVFPVLALLIASVAAAPSGGLMSKMLNSAPLRWVGAVSYSIYMTHWIILLMIGRLLALTRKNGDLGDSNWLGLMSILLAVSLVLAVSQFTYKWIERPCQKGFRELSEKYFGAWQNRLHNPLLPVPHKS